MASRVDKEQLKRWRLILGQHAQDSLAQMGGAGGCELSPEQIAMDEALAAIYDETGGEGNKRGQRSAGLGPSAPNLAKWLGDIRSYFKEDVVTVIQNDAIERKGLTQLLFEPEMLKNVEPNAQLVGTLMSLKGRIPERTKETARMVVRAVVEKIKRLLEQKIRQAVMGALNRNEHSPIPHAASIDWKWTIGRNLKNYQPSLGTIVPEKVYFFSRAQRSNNWTVIVCMDQSGSMAESVVYGSVTGSIFASLPALNTRVVAFDTEVVDLTEQCGNDPVDMIFGVQLGGGTDINKAVAYCETVHHRPGADDFLPDHRPVRRRQPGPARAPAQGHGGIRRARDLPARACPTAACQPSINNLAKKIAEFGVPCFGCTPNKLPELIEGVLKKQDLKALAALVATKKETATGR